MSSAPVCLTSTPETGKSTVAYQFCKRFFSKYSNGIAAYFDVEGVGGQIENGYSFQQSRPETFGLDKYPTWSYRRSPFNIKQFFGQLKSLIEYKQKYIDEGEIKLLVVLDSIAALPSSKLMESEDYDKMPGARANEMSYYLNKFKMDLAFHRPTWICIDQLRQNFNMKSKFEKADEQTVGIFRNFKSASQITALQHMISQWIMMSKGPEILLSSGWGIDGWLVNLFIEKNKITPSKFEIQVVFDKRSGIHPFWSELLFISKYSPSEDRLIKKKMDPFLPLGINSDGAWSVLSLKDPKTGKIHKYHKKFYKKNSLKLYNEDPEFAKVFNTIVDISIKHRIQIGLLRMEDNCEDEVLNTIEMDINDDDKEVLDSTSVISKKKTLKKKIAKKKDKTIVITQEPSNLNGHVIEDAPVSNNEEVFLDKSK